MTWRMELDGVGMLYDEEVVLNDLSVKIADGLCNVIVGPSGCGKSTIVDLVAGFVKPSFGSIKFDGKSIKGPNRDRLVVFQESALFPWMRVRENVLFGPKMSIRSEDKTLSAEPILERVGLIGFEEKYPTQLSGGMQRRAEMARAMINAPRFMILDEPFRGLDALTRELMWEYYNFLLEKEEITTIFVTTNIDEAVFLADRIIVLTNKPTCVHSVIDVELPRPRRLRDTTGKIEFKKYKANILKILYQESMKGFSEQSDAAKEFVDALEL